MLHIMYPYTEVQNERHSDAMEKDQFYVVNVPDFHALKLFAMPQDIVLRTDLTLTRLRCMA